MFLYCGSTPHYQTTHNFKLGSTSNLRNRMNSYQTSHPPHDHFIYVRAWKINATTRKEMYMYEQQVHDAFSAFRLFHTKLGDSEWFQFPSTMICPSPVDLIHEYICSQPWFVSIATPEDYAKISGSISKTSSSQIEYIQEKEDTQTQTQEATQHLQAYQVNLKFIHKQEERQHALDAFQRPLIAELCGFLESDIRAGIFCSPCGTGKTRMTVMALATRIPKFRGVSSSPSSSSHHPMKMKMKMKMKCIVCCPSLTIQRQWYETFYEHSNFTESMFLFIGSTGTTDMATIAEFMKQDSWCILVTYMSSHLLCPFLSDEISVIVFDEAHHMAGRLPTSPISSTSSTSPTSRIRNTEPELEPEADTETKGIGHTRKLLYHSLDKSIKRLFVTYTPKYIHEEDMEENENDKEEHTERAQQASPSPLSVLSMNNERVFGKVLVSVSLRTCIDLGILPDYRIWRLYQTTTRPITPPVYGHVLHARNDRVGVDHTEQDIANDHELYPKIHSIAEAWNETHIVCHKEQYILHHMVIFASTIDESKKIAQCLRIRFPSTTVLHVDQSSNIKHDVEQFNNAPRAIFVNCYMLGEGVDIPIANAVVFMYPKQSHVQITQMILRAGRWYPNKPIFHILLPTHTAEDMSGYEGVLLSLAKHDPLICNELMTLATSKLDGVDESTHTDSTDMGTEYSLDSILNKANRHIMIDEYASTEEAIRECFTRIRKHILGVGGYRQVRTLCSAQHIHTHVDYDQYRKTHAELDLPPDPRPRGMTWFRFLNPYTSIVTFDEFHETVHGRYEITSTQQYQRWLARTCPKDMRDEFPSIQNINDECFDGIDNLNQLFHVNHKTKKRR